MSDATPRDSARALLGEALDLFNDHPRFSLRRDRSRTSYALAARIKAYLSTDYPAHTAIAVARNRWGTSGFLRIDLEEREHERQDGGYWVRAWVRVDPIAVGEIDPRTAAHYRAAVEALPDLTGRILRAHQQDKESIAMIAGRLGLTTTEVERHIGEALTTIVRRLERKG